MFSKLGVRSMTARIETAINCVKLVDQKVELLSDKCDLLEKQVSLQHDVIINLKDLIIEIVEAREARSQKLEKDK